MSPYRIGLVIVVVLLNACTGSPHLPPVASDTPKALQENSGSSSIISKRGPDLVVENLYADCLKRTLY